MLDSLGTILIRAPAVALTGMSVRSTLILVAKIRVVQRRFPVPRTPGLIESLAVARLFYTGASPITLYTRKRYYNCHNILGPGYGGSV